ncbi:hypothetical protein [Actinoplanes sp. DH11]|uniref:hypothetical protein n=1 Tax=Actinoplanes sp. DH11 TaxID=2857011 RepID=UPI001E4E88C4|nr:hypothetical protein [Actinoplanes sp. DH11]
MPFIDVIDPAFGFSAPEVSAAQDEHWYADSPLGPLVLRHAQAQELLRDRRLDHGGDDYLRRNGITSGPIHDWWVPMIVNRDGADHRRLRGLVGRSFTPRTVDLLRPFIRTTIEALADDLDGADFVAAFADRLPLAVMGELLGVPAADHDIFSTWSSDIGLIFALAAGTGTAAPLQVPLRVSRNRTPGTPGRSRPADGKVYRGAVSVDSSGNMPRAAALSSIMDSAGTTIRTLLGVTIMPDLQVVTDVHTARRVVLRPEQESTLLGGLDRHGDNENSWEVGLPETGDWVRLILHRYLSAPVDPATLPDDDDPWFHPSLGCDPVRTGVAMVLSVGLALGAALVGGGLFETQLTVWRHDLADPAEVIAGTRVSPTDLPFREACIRYMDQFPDSKPGWGWSPNAP